ncbi:MAG: TonB-dependent receptor domain-containing protein, partial [Bacteroidia bacterium]
GGYGIKNQKFAVNVNLYYTIWQNKPLTQSASGPNGTVYFNILGLNALHKGIEIDFIYKLLKNLEFQGVVSLGDWKNTSGSTVDVVDANGVLIQRVDFSAKNVHVGNAAQTQLVGNLRYTLFKNLYLKPRFTYFAKNYANFNPLQLTGDNKDRDSWKMPNYGLLDMFVGYDFKYSKLKFTITAGVVNILNTVYISDASNGVNFDASTLGVYMGMGRRINMGLRIGF